MKTGVISMAGVSVVLYHTESVVWLLLIMLLQVSDEKEKVAQKEIQNLQFGEMKIGWKRGYNYNC